MENFKNLTHTSIRLNDANLLTYESDNTGRSLLLIGTAEYGSLYVPIRIRDAGDLASNFGDPNTGTLIKGAYEALTAVDPSKFNLWCLRVGNGSEASLNISEQEGSGLYAPLTPESAAMSLVSKNPGSIFNKTVVFMDLYETSEGVLPHVRVYNPKTETYSNYQYSSNKNIGTIHNVGDLVEAINADPNLNGDYLATLNKRITSNFEAKLDLASSGDSFTDLNGVTDNSNGYYTINFSGVFLNNPTYFNVISGVVDDNDCMVFGTLPADEGVDNRYKLPVTAVDGLISLDLFGVRNTLELSADTQGKFKIELNNVVKLRSDGVAFPINSLNFSQKNTYVATSNGTDTSFSIDLKSVLDASSLVVYVTTSDGSVDTLVEDTHYTKTNDGTTWTFDFSAGTSPFGAPVKNSIVTIDFDSNDITMIQYTNLQDCLDTKVFTNYFIAGKTIYFGNILPFDIALSYYYDKSASKDEAYILNNEDGEIMIKSSLVDDIDVLYLQFKWSYLPEWIDLSSALNLTGGTDGVSMTPEDKYVELDNAFKGIYNFPVDIIVPIDFKLGEVKTIYSTINGKAGTAIVDYFGLVKEHLNSRLDYSGASYAFLTCEQPSAYDITTIDNYIKTLTETTSGDSVQSFSNYLDEIESIQIGVLVGSPLIAHKNVTTPYIASPECIVGARMAALPGNEVITHEKANNILKDMLSLSLPQINTLCGKRFIPFGIWDNETTLMNGDSFTLSTSQYRRISTFFIIKDILNAITQKLKVYYKNLERATEKNALMEVDVNEILTDFSKNKKLIGPNYPIKIYSTAQEDLRGIKHLRINIAPAQETKNIIIDVNIDISK